MGSVPREEVSLLRSNRCTIGGVKRDVFGPLCRVMMALSPALLTVVALKSFDASAQPPDRAMPLTVELITIGVGDPTYARFGHAALETRRGNGSLSVYNFGFSDFDRPELVPEFLRGRARFWVARQSLPDMITEYIAEDRTIIRQKLNLSPAQHHELARLLRRAALPQNKFYVYHHFDDNCTTRLRDLLDRVTDGAVRRAWAGQSARTTLRALMRRGFAGQPALQVVADTLVGRRADRELSLWDAAFLPQIHAEALRQVRLDDGRPLAGPPKEIYRRRAPDPRDHGLATGRLILWCVALLAGLCLAFAASRRRWTALPLSLGAILFGGLGALVWALALYSTLPELSQNELLLLLWPTDLLVFGAVAARVRGRPPGRWLWFYGNLRLAGLSLVLLGHAAGWFWQGPAVWLVAATLWSLAVWRSTRINCDGRPDRAAARSARPPGAA